MGPTRSAVVGRWRPAAREPRVRPAGDEPLFPAPGDDSPVIDDPGPAGDPSGAPDDLAWETLDSTIDYTCPGFDVRLDRVRYPDGREGEFHSVTEPAAVVVLPFVGEGAGGDEGDDGEGTGDRELVVISEWRQAVGRVNLGLPAGSHEPEDDDLAETARRELAEETGYVAGSVERLLAVEPINGVADVVHHYFLARGCRPDGEQDLDHNESIRVETTTFPVLREAVLAGEVRDGRTVTGVLFYDRVMGD